MSTPAQLSELRRLARAQHGVLSLAQARAAGLSEDTVGRRLASKAWRPAGVRVFPVAEHQSALAAAGWVVLRTHSYQLHEHPDAVLATLRRTLASRSRAR